MTIATLASAATVRTVDPAVRATLSASAALPASDLPGERGTARGASGDAEPATPSRRKRTTKEKDNLEYQAMMRRMLRAYGRRVKAEDPSTLGELMALRSELDDVINACARSLHDEGEWSWGEIGAEIGITRNAAWKRWGQDGAE